MSLETTKDLAIVLGTVVALTTFLSGVVEFARQSHYRRVEHFIEMRRRFLETPLFQEILRLLSTDDPSLMQIPIQDRRNFGGFIEEVALMVNSRLIGREVAHYMFGHYVLLTARSENFWHGLDRGGTYWKLFNTFAEDMKVIANRPVSPARLRF